MRNHYGTLAIFISYFNYSIIIYLILFQAIDVGLVLKLQQKLKKLENERDVLHRQIEERNDSPSEQKPHDAFKVSVQ